MAAADHAIDYIMYRLIIRVHEYQGENQESFGDLMVQNARIGN